jgi:hypothetical protein
MTGSIRIDSQLAEQIDSLVREFIQQNVFRGTVKVTTVSRGTREWRKANNTIGYIPYYDINYEGVLDLLAGQDEKDKV